MFIGRKNELRLLKKANWRDKAQLIVVYGRRRVGKTALVEKAYESDKMWKFEGIEGVGTKKQIQHFLFLLSQNSGIEDIKKKEINTWQEAFLLLNECIGSQKLIIFFDEFQWLSSMRKQCVAAFKWCWDNYLSKHKNCKFILCGSISSFIIKHVIKSTALYGRVDVEINLKPFSISEVSSFFKNRYNKQEIIDIYMTFGGIPQYLLELETDKSYIQNLNQLAFAPNGYFYQEYQRLFISHFSHNLQYERILSSLSNKNGQSVKQSASSVNIKTGGTFTKLLSDLELAGFIERYTPVDKQNNSKLVRFRIYDEFLNFYFTFIKKHKKEIEEETVAAYELLTGNTFKQWQGYAFEKLCRKHAKSIAKILEFSGIRYKFGSWFRLNDSNKIQIDLLFIRADNVLTLCETKNATKLNSSTVIPEFEKKINHINSVFQLPIQKVLISAKKIKMPNKITEYFDNVLFAEDVFF